ncbi:hypothetical protein V6N13_013093 [Hibiscus sabdariffa]
MIKLSLALQHSLHYPLIMSSLKALNIVVLLLFCLILVCVGVSSFITFVIYIQIAAYKARIRNRLQIPNTVNVSSEVEDDGLVLNVQALERLSPSVTINEDDKNELNSSECPICLEEYSVGESCRRFPVCRHAFHSSCIDHWLHNHVTCPCDVHKIDSAPFWIKLWHVPLELYSQTGLGYIASALGKPLYTDRGTVLKQSLEFAKICVELDAKFVLPESVTVDLGMGRTVDVNVEQVWSPPRCSFCSIFGYADQDCAKKKSAEVLVNPIDRPLQDMFKGVDVVVDNDSSKFESCSGSGVDMESVVSPRVCEVNVVLQSEGSVPVVEGDLVVPSSVAKEVDAVNVVGSSPNDASLAVVGSVGIGSSYGQMVGSNRFDALCFVAEGQEAPVVSPRKQRVAASGVADLMEQLKPKGKAGQNKKKKGKGVQKGLNVETRVRKENAGAIVASKFKGWNFINNYDDASGGRIWILSRNSWQVDIIHSSTQVVHCLLRQGVVSFFLSVVYGSNSREERRELWRTLVDVKRSVGDCPWALAGDFNIMFSPQESSDYNGSQRITGAMQEFLDCKEELDVDSQGFNLDTFESISGELVRFFSGSLGVVDDNVEHVSDDLLKELLGVELTVEMQNSLIAPVTNKEIKDGLKV